mmetsp:Transcript_133788/g.416124  ORF Transcript_133788/g.416124 Transcript_133788/m.416124 type:complete len:158 (+) Transcript_133788:202-675(+)
MGAQEITQLKPQFDALGAHLVLVGYEDTGAQEFLDGKFWEGDVYIDKPHAVFKALGTKTAGLWTLATPSVLAGIRKAASKGVPKNMSGGTTDPTLGGTYVVSGGDFVYEYQHQNFADHASGEEVLNACTSASKGTVPMPPGKPAVRGGKEGGGCSLM